MNDTSADAASQHRADAGAIDRPLRAACQEGMKVHAVSRGPLAGTIYQMRLTAG